jgi:outer membrane receptor protein involved in Fe transport
MSNFSFLLKFRGVLLRALGAVAGFAMILLVVPQAIHAQNATISGTITDKSNAVAPGVTVTATNTATNVTHSGETGDSGVYHVLELAPGSYNISVEKAGFKTARYANLILNVGENFTLDVVLEISSVASSVEVNALELPPVELENAQVSNLVDSVRITGLPLLTRNPYDLILLSPGVTQANSSLGGFSNNGTNQRNNNFLLDGVDNNDTDVPGIPGGINSLNPDATQEFRVVTNNFSAEYGRNNGALIEIVTTSGTNDLHGSVYEFGRYNALGARDFFNPGGPDGGPQNPYVRNDFGASIRGPIIKDKTFYFGNYEGQRFITSITNTSIVPTEAFKTGKFTITQDESGNPLAAPVPIDVSTANAQNNGWGVPLDPNVQKILALYPKPNGPAVTDVSGVLFYPSASRQTTDDFTIKVDHQLTKKHSLFVRYAYNRFTDPDAFHDDFLPNNLGATNTYQRTQAAAIGVTSTLTNNLVNEFRFGANRTNLQFNCTGTNVLDSFGNVDSLGRGPDYIVGFGNPSFNTFGCAALGDTNAQARFTGTYHTVDNVSYSRGRHTFKWGGEFRAVYSNSFDNFSSRQTLDFRGDFNFGITSLVNVPPEVLSNTSLNDQVEALLGVVIVQSQNQFFDSKGVRSADDLRGFRQREMGLFAQDTWKVLPNLTFTYGLRWEYYGVPFEVNNLLSNLFVDPSGPAPFTLTQVGPGRSHDLYGNQWNNFEPRIGLAWDPFKTGKTSVRAGYGIYHDRVFGNLVGNARGNPPFTETFSANPELQTTDLVTPPTVPSSATVTNIDPVTFTGGQIFPDLFDPHFKTPYSQNWNLGIQRQLTNSLTLEVNYVGVKGNRLFRVVDGNPPQPALVSQLLQFCSNPGNAFGCDTSTLTFASLWLGAEFAQIPFDATNNNAFEAAFSTPGAVLNKSIGNSNYHGLQVNIQQRLSHGFQIQGTYTYSHSISDVNDPLGDGTAFGNRSFPRNSFNLRAEKGNSDFDIRHRGVINFLYTPNIGRGKAYLNHGFAGRVFEGWGLSGITSLQSGHPIDLFGNRDSNHTGLSARLSIIGNPSQPKGTDKTFTGPALSAFEKTPYDVQPTVGKNAFYGPDYINFDAALLKDTGITERIKLQLRFEFFNLFNHTQFGQPGNLIQSPGTFGVSTSTITREDGTTSARQIQVAAKIVF